MRISPKLSILLVLAIGYALGLATGLTATPLNKKETVKTTHNPRIIIESTAPGRVMVHGWDKQEVLVSVASDSGRLKLRIEKLPPEGPTDQLLVSVWPTEPNDVTVNDKADLLLKIPSEVQLEIVKRSRGPVNMEMLWGDITARTVSGNITLTDVGGHLAIKSMSGNIYAVRPTGRVEVKSVTGNINFEWPESSQIYAGTTTGAISYEGDFFPRGNYRFVSHSGDIEVTCPGYATFNLQASTVRGRLEGSGFSTGSPRLGQRTSMSNFVGSRHAGNALVQLSTFNGAIRIHRQQ